MQDSSWEQYGSQDPYYGVLSDPRFRSNNINEAALKEFFQSGEEHIREVIGKLNFYFPSSISGKFQQVLDFGCGTGRLLIPLAERFEHVTGVDIAPGMLQEAEKNLKQRNLDNVTCIQSGDITAINFNHAFDFVHTFIVLQHIPLEAGYRIIDKLVSLIKEDGYGMIHFTYANNLSDFENRKTKLLTRYKWIKKCSNLIKGKSMDAPLMEMNRYDLPRVFNILRKYNMKEISLDFTDHSGHYGVCLYLHK